jgi:predicted transcriptional regulator
MQQSKPKMVNFANSLYNLRVKKSVSQIKLAKLSGYTQPYLSLIETGKVNPSKRCRKDLLRALGNPSSRI